MEKKQECVKKEPEIKQWFDVERPCEEAIAALEKQGDKLCGVEEGVALARAYSAGQCDASEVYTCMNYLCSKNNASRIVGSKSDFIERFFNEWREHKCKVLMKIFGDDYKIDDIDTVGERIYNKALWFDAEQPSEDEVKKYRDMGYEFHNLVRSVQMAKEYSEGRREVIDIVNEINDFTEKDGVFAIVDKEWFKHLLDEITDYAHAFGKVLVLDRI
jgi:hypothetical protein